MRRRTRKCPLCSVGLTGKLNLPNSKHLDHIVPLNQGGTHTHGNVRIICASCNLRRPKDGSDFIGQVTLWAQSEVPVSRMTKQEKRRYLPVKCRCAALFAAPGRTLMCPSCTEDAGRKAAELHAGGLAWPQVAAQVGYTTAEGARYAAKRIGYVSLPRPKAEKPGRICADCGTPKRKGAQDCEPCTTARARQVVQMRNGGMTLREISDHLGYSSISSVTNLMARVVTVSKRMGRPPSTSSEDAPVQSPPL